MLEYIVRGVINLFSKNKFEKKEEEHIMEKINQFSTSNNQSILSNQDLINIISLTSFNKSNKLEEIFKTVKNFSSIEEFGAFLSSDKPNNPFIKIINDELSDLESIANKFNKNKHVKVEFPKDSSSFVTPGYTPNKKITKTKHEDLNS